MLEDMTKIDECDMEKFGTLDGSEKTNAILGDRWWPQTAKQEGGEANSFLKRNTWENVMNAQTFEVSIFGVGPVLRLERAAWSVVK